MLPELVERSRANVRWYAYGLCAEFQLWTGVPWRSGFSPNAQKLAILNPDFDSFEGVAMLDCDMFAVSSLTENLFETPGNGFHQQQAHRRVSVAFPGLSSPDAPFYGGPLYKFSREERKALRAEMDFNELKRLDCAAGGWDEGMMHRLAMRAGLPACYLPERWAWSSYYPTPEKAAFIHVRTKPTGDKLRNYEALKAKGIIQ